VLRFAQTPAVLLIFDPIIYLKTNINSHRVLFFFASIPFFDKKGRNVMPTMAVKKAHVGPN
jgi:hypothetical protein